MKLRRIFKFGKILTMVFLFVLSLVAIFPLIPPFRGYYKTRAVLTGSMKPVILPGSLIITRWWEDKDLKEGDIITYRRPDQKDFYITHRIIKKTKEGDLYFFQTKGDRVSAPDQWKIHQGLIEGKVILVFPFLGYFYNFAKSWIGFGLLILLPAVLIIVEEIRKIKKALKISQLNILFLVGSFLFSQVFLSFAYFSSGAVAMTGVTLSTMVWDFDPPSSEISFPPNNYVTNQSSIIISGTAWDVGAGVKMVEVGVTPEGGETTWYQASGTTNWSYSWSIPAEGVYQIQSRAKDNGEPTNNVETPGGGIKVIVDWTPPESSATDNQPDYQNTRSFNVDYTASDNLSGVKEVRLYYRYNHNNWQLFGTETRIDGKFEFNSPEGDGFYEFKTVAIDQAGNEELDSLFADASTTVDTTPPVTMLSTPNTMAVTNELLYNGGFENGNLDGWTVDSNGSDHQVTSEDKKTGDYSALIGFKTAAPSAEPAFDSIRQNVSLPSWITSTLSFWYRLMTNTNVSGGFFDVFVIPPAGGSLKIAHDGWDDPAVLSTDLGWKNVVYQLNGLEGKDVGIEFKVTQPYKEYQTWAYLDDVRLTAAPNSTTTTTQLFLTSNDGAGSNNSAISYILNDNPPATYSGTPITLGTSGQHTLKYFSTDEAGNTEPEKQITITATSAAQVDFGVVLNEFLPNPEGNDNASKPNGEWVKLYNNSTSDVDVNGWVLYDAYDTHELVISATNSDNDGNPLDSGETIVPAGGILTVYRNGDGDFELNNTGGDTVRLYNAPVGSGGVLVDSFTYKIDAKEGKSFRRVPDGTGTWKDPEVEPVVDFYLQPNKTAVGFKIKGIGQYQKLNYEIFYQAGEKEEGIVGTINLSGEEEITRDGFILGTCSSGGTCVYHSGIKEIKLKINLTDQNNNQKILEKTINYGQI